MTVHVAPDNCSAWLETGGAVFAPPPAFDLIVLVFEAGHPFIGAGGVVPGSDHPLSGLWVVLWRLTATGGAIYNIRAFRRAPDEASHYFGGEPWRMGFATVTPV